MNKLNPIKFGVATGFASILFYIGCMLLILILGQTGTIKISNMLFHGVDFSNIIRTSIPITESLLGIVCSFIIWGLFGVFLAFFYNLLLNKKS